MGEYSLGTGTVIAGDKQSFLTSKYIGKGTAWKQVEYGDKYSFVDKFRHEDQYITETSTDQGTRTALCEDRQGTITHMRTHTACGQVQTSRQVQPWK